jgi:RNA polymerase sigma-70 factor (ECF subfamily)
VYPELRRLAAHYMRSKSATLQPTALVHELYLRLMSGTPIDWQNRAHFFAIAARKLRYILVDHARRARLGKQVRVDFARQDLPSGISDVDILAVHEAMERLDAINSRSCSVLEMQFFGGMNDAETAEVLHVSVPTVRRDSRFGRAWMAVHLKPLPPDASDS